jgi:nucleotide-binding universal stress UspA family protein
VLGLFAEGNPTAGLLRASALCRVLGAELHVLRVLPDTTRVNALFPQNNLADASAGLAASERSDASTRAWLSQTLHGPNTVEFELAHGDFVQQVAAYATRLDAKLIVVAPGVGRLGRTVTALAGSAGVPVLLARQATAEETIVAATDLESLGFPVLKQAAELGRRLQAPVVALHNASPASLVVGIDMVHPVAAVVRGPSEAKQAERLARATDQLQIEVDAVVRGALDPVEAILAEARAQDADLVVVGMRRRKWLGRWLAASVAAQIVDQARRSVLVTPLDEPRRRA